MTERPPADRPPFPTRYLAGELDELYGIPAGRVECGLARPVSTDRDELVAALAEQARARGDGAAQLAAIERLRHPDARAVVTGQQAGLLLGPTFTLSKAFSAIALARRHDRDDRPVVPVFWVASQDHDAAEIDHAHLLDRSERLHRVVLPFEEGVPSGRMALRAAWRDDLRKQLARLDVPDAHRREVEASIFDAWDEAGSVADLFARTMSALLGDHGLVVADPMHGALARTFAPVLRAELADPLVGPEAIREAAAALKSRGERPQLGRGQDATNLFVGRSGGPRRLLRWSGGRFHPDGRPEERLTASDLTALLEDDPAALTPAAGLRPIVQDAVLPTAAVVVGPGELRYYAQLRGVYAFHDVAMPLVWPRATVTVLEPPIVRILKRYDLDAAAFVADPDGSERETLLRLAGHAEAFDAARTGLDREVARLLTAAEGIDPTLAGPVRRGREVLATTVERLRAKSGRALARREVEADAQFARLRAHLLPDGRPQERVLSPFSLFLKFGVQPVLARFASLEPEGEQYLTIDGGDP